LPNVLVLVSPTQATAGSSAPISGTYIVRVPTSKAAKFAYVGQNGSFWLVLRPANKALPTRPALEPSNNILGGG
jgi:hypothetical protein